MSNRLPFFKYSHEILHDRTPVQDPAYPQRDANQKMEGSVPKPGKQLGSMGTATCFAFISTSQDEQNSAQVKIHFYFSA